MEVSNDLLDLELVYLTFLRYFIFELFLKTSFFKRLKLNDFNSLKRDML